MKSMVDTVKLSITILDPSLLRKGAFAPLSVEQLVGAVGSNSRTYLNPSPVYAKAGKYMPRLTLHRRPRKGIGIQYVLDVEFSAPKMLFGNNFDELEEKDFDALLTALQAALHELLGYKFFKTQLARANISAWHPSKNIVFLDYTSCQTILNTIGKLNVSKTYDLQKTDFRDGHVVHIHANSLDIAFYDKMADLLKAKRSGKRAFENDSAVQLSLIEKLPEYRPMEVFRYEVRFVVRASIKRAFPELEQWTFESLYKKDLCQRILLKHWNKITDSVDMLALDVREPYELLQNYLEANDGITPQTALAAVAGLTITSQVGVVGLRNLLEARYGKQAWYRIKSLLKSPDPYRFMAFIHIDEALRRFTPTRISDFLSNIESSVK